MYPNNEGPQSVKIPEQNVVTCSGCKYHDHKLVRSGRDPVYRDDCVHPENGQDKAFKLSFTGNLKKNMTGFIITPDWCPFKKQGVKQ